MQAKAQSQSSLSAAAKCKRKIVRWVLVILAGLVLLMFFGVPAYISSQSGRAMILAKINSAVGGRTDFAELSMRWLQGIKLRDFSYVSDSGDTSIAAKRIITRPRYRSIILGTLAFGKTVIDEPAVKINVPDASPNRGQSSKSKTSANRKPKAVGLPVQRIDLIVNNGNVRINRQWAAKQPQSLELARINSKVNLRPPGRKTKFKVDLQAAGGQKPSQIKAAGHIEPAKKHGWSLKGTSGDFVIEVDGLDLASLGPFFAAAGMDVEAEGGFSTLTKLTLADGKPTKVDARISGSGFRIKAPQLKGDTFSADKLDVKAKLETDDELIRIDDIDIKTDWLNAEARGVVPKTLGSFADFLKPGSAHSLTGKFDCNLAAAASIMPRTLGLKDAVRITGGRLTATFDTYTRQDKREIIAKATLADLKGIVGGKAAALSAPVIVDAKVISDKAEARLDSFEVSASFCKVRCTGPIDWLDYSAEVDLAALQADLGRFIDIGEYNITGKVSSTGNIAIARDKVTSSGSSRVTDLRVTYPGQKPFEQDEVVGSFDIHFNPAEKTWAIKSLKLSSPQIKVRQAQLEQSRKGNKMLLTASLDAEYDLEAVSTVATPFLPRGLKIKGAQRHKISFASEYPTAEPEKLLANLSTKAKFGFDQAQYLGLLFGPVETNIQTKKGLLTISPFSGTVNNGKFNFAANADFKQTPVLLKNLEPIEMKAVQISDATTRQLLMYLNPIFANAVNVSGVMNFYCETLAIPLAGAGKNDLEIAGTLSIDNLQLRPYGLLGQIITLIGATRPDVRMRIHPTRFVLRNGLISYDDMQLDVGDNPVNFKGVIGLDKTLNMEVTLPYTLHGRTARVGRETVGQRITLPLRGTTDKPELDMSKLLEEQLKKELIRGLQKLLK